MLFKRTVNNTFGCCLQNGPFPMGLPHWTWFKPAGLIIERADKDNTHAHAQTHNHINKPSQTHTDGLDVIMQNAACVNRLCETPSSHWIKMSSTWVFCEWILQCMSLHNARVIWVSACGEAHVSLGDNGFGKGNSMKAASEGKHHGTPSASQSLSDPLIYSNVTLAPQFHLENHCWMYSAFMYLCYKERFNPLRI